MIIDHINKAIHRIINYQFKVIGEDIIFKDIPEGGEIIIGKKKKMWYDVYQYKNEEQYLQWKIWALEELEKGQHSDKFDTLDMIWGLHIAFPKTEKPQLELFS